jgi:hypothetical protein
VGARRSQTDVLTGSRSGRCGRGALSTQLRPRRLSHARAASSPSVSAIASSGPRWARSTHSHASGGSGRCLTRDDAPEGCQTARTATSATRQHTPPAIDGRGACTRTNSPAGQSPRRRRRDPEREPCGGAPRTPGDQPARFSSAASRRALVHLFDGLASDHQAPSVAMRTIRTWRALRQQGRRLNLWAVARGWS